MARKIPIETIIKFVLYHEKEDATLRGSLRLGDLPLEHFLQKSRLPLHF